MGWTTATQQAKRGTGLPPGDLILPRGTGLLPGDPILHPCPGFPPKTHHRPEGRCHAFHPHIRPSEPLSPKAIAHNSRGRGDRLRGKPSAAPGYSPHPYREPRKGSTSLCIFPQTPKQWCRCPHRQSRKPCPHVARFILPTRSPLEAFIAEGDTVHSRGQSTVCAANQAPPPGTAPHSPS